MKLTTQNTLTKLLELLKSKLDTLLNAINAKPSIDDNTPSTQAVYSSSKVEELLESAGGGSTPKQIVTPLSGFFTQDSTGAYVAMLSIGTDDLTNKTAIIDCVTDSDLEKAKEIIAEYSKIISANIVYYDANTRAPSPPSYNGSYLELRSEEAINDSSLTIKVLLLDKEDTKTGNLDTIYTDESCSAILTNRVPASSGGSTLYEFSTPLKLNYFTKNYYDDNIPYYSVITSLADYITDTNKIAVIIPDTSEANAGQLKYTEVIDDGVIKCYFTQELDGYSIKSIEIRNISKKESVIPKINFTISDFYDSDYKYSCAAESGMTWSEWCSSEYNTIGAIVNETYIQVPNSEGELKNVQIIFTANVLPDDEIKNMTYNIL